MRIIRTRTALLAGGVAAIMAIGAACSPPPPPPPEVPLDPGCYSNPGPQVDFVYDGPIDTVENAYYVASNNGLCDGPMISTRFTIVQAVDQTSAIATCVGLGLPSSASNFSAIGFNTPADIWTCNDA